MRNLLFWLLTSLLLASCSNEDGDTGSTDGDTDSDTDTDGDTDGDTDSDTDGDTDTDADTDTDTDTDADSDADCEPSCGTNECGSDGCDGVCGVCDGSAICQTGVCVPVTGADVVVDGGTVTHPISPDIYGLAFASPAQLADLNVPLNRWGGNSTTRYNWQLDVHNTAADWYFQNIADNGEGTYGTAGYLTSEEVFLRDTLNSGATALITIPTIGWTPKDRKTDHPFSCGFPATKYPSQQSFDQYDLNCGNGKLPSGDDFSGDGTDALNTSVATDETDATARIQHLMNGVGADWTTGTHYYALDNEMMLWEGTHRDVHPDPVSFAEVWEKTETYAPVIKAADPAAFVMGYGTWTAWDILEANVDGEAETYGMTLMEWYLQQLADYEESNGSRIVDCIDLHFYPQQDAGNEAAVLNSPRTLWDRNYVEESWLNDVFPEDSIYFIPRVRDWINARYPGTEICMSEYNFFPDNDLSVVVQAEVLGVFGREDVRLAAWWTTPWNNDNTTKAPYWSFRMFRNYDGNNGTFGDQALAAGSVEPGVSVFAARRSSDDRETIMLINKNAAQTEVNINLTGIDATGMTPWSIAEGQGAITEGASIPVAAGSLTVSIPAHAVLLLVADN